MIGDKQTTANLRYKHGRNLNYEPKEVLAFRDPKEAGLPVPTVNSSFIFAYEGDGFLCYPNNAITISPSITTAIHFNMAVSAWRK